VTLIRQSPTSTTEPTDAGEVRDVPASGTSEVVVVASGVVVVVVSASLGVEDSVDGDPVRGSPVLAVVFEPRHAEQMSAKSAR
jgi:hypothetical protein